MYKIWNYLFEWDYIAWVNSAGASGGLLNIANLLEEPPSTTKANKRSDNISDL